ncbi:MAG: hypothetical protein WC839_02305 [Candidatus Paceibacterota bacterium]
MSKRNLILLIIILTTLIIGGFIVFYFYQKINTGGDTTSGTNFFADFLPFGKSKNITPKDTTSPTNVSGYIPPTETETSIIKLKKISSFPIAGFGIFMKERFKDVMAPDPNATPQNLGEIVDPIDPNPPTTETEIVPAIRYVRKSNGNIYQTFADKIDERKFSSTVIPTVYEAFFGNNGESVLMRYLKKDNQTIETFLSTLQKEYLGADSVGINEVNGYFLPENVSDLSISSDMKKVFYLFNSKDTTIGNTVSLEDTTKIQVFDSSFSEWLSSWPSTNMITVTTKPSYATPGFMYAIDPTKKDFNKVLGGINGLTTLTSPSETMVLNSDNTLSLSIFNKETGVSSSLDLQTLPEKCVWGTASDVIYCAVPKSISGTEYPDSWYQGETSFSDQIWKIDVESRNTTMISDLSSVDGTEDIDGIKLSLDENQNFLFFVNKKDSYLWELQLK